MRKIVEGAAARLAANVTPAFLRDLRGLVREQTECLKAADVKRQEKLDDLFHRTLYGAIGNDTLVDLIFATWERTKQARCASTANPEHGRRWIAASIRRHKLVLEALASGDGEEGLPRRRGRHRLLPKRDHRLPGTDGMDRTPGFKQEGKRMNRLAIISAFLGSVKNRYMTYQADRVLEEKFRMAAAIEGVAGLELCYPADFQSIPKLKELLAQSGFGVSAVNFRSRRDGKWWRGSFTSASAAERREFVDEVTRWPWMLRAASSAAAASPTAPSTMAATTCSKWTTPRPSTVRREPSPVAAATTAG